MSAGTGMSAGTRRRLKVGAATVGLAFALAACGGSDDDGDPTGASGGERPSSTASLEIAAPTNGEVVSGQRVTLSIDLEDATIVPQTTREIAPDEGHLHVTLDGALISMTEGTEQELTGLTPGPHRVQVEFVAADHVPFDPRVVAVAAFEVEG